VAALIAVPSIAMAAPDQNTNGNNNNACRGGQWVNGQCVYNNNNNNGNGRWNNNGNTNGQHTDRDDRARAERDRLERERWQREHQNGSYNNGGYNNGGYNNGSYNNGGYNNGAYGGYNNGNYGNNGRNGNWNYGRGNQLSGTVSSFSPYNLYLNNGQHVELHNGTVINPTGTNLSPGMRVRIIGAQNSDGTFNANEIDVVGNGGYRY
jgi:hypothetical protein